MNLEDLIDEVESLRLSNATRGDALLQLQERNRKLEKVAKAAKAVLSEPVVAEHLTCYVMGVELIDRLAALEAE